MKFKPINLSDKQIFTDFLSQDPPQVSELTFTNLFMWRRRYQTVWSRVDDCLLIVMRSDDGRPFALPPVGPGDKVKALELLSLQLSKFSSDAKISRVCKNFVEKYVDQDLFHVEGDGDNSDYVYLAQDLIELPGNKFHKKKNHINKFVKNYQFEYRSLDPEVVQASLDLQENWCELRDCGENPDLLHEDLAIYEALKNYDQLDFRGGAILISSKVEAFALGELLNPDTAVIHIEKANPQIPGLYAAINQRFCAEEWSHVKYINREQDLGLANLRKAKQSYHPHHIVEKFTLTRQNF